MTMERKSNIELLRIVSMLMVLFLHSNYVSIGEVTPADIESALVASFGKAIAEQLCIIAVNLFIFISGWFGIKPSFKGVCALMYQVLFYHVLISGLALFCGVPISFSMFIAPFRFGIPYWFVVSYVTMYVLTPVMNVFIEKVSARGVFSVLISFYVIQSTTGFCAHFGGFNAGYSSISFIGLYLLARFIRLHAQKIKKIRARYDIYLYLLFSIIPVLLFFITKRNFDMTSYCSPFVIVSTVFFFLSFSHLNISNKIINYVATSVSSVYLIHTHPLVWGEYCKIMSIMHDYLGGGRYVVYVIISSILFLLCCVVLDKVRIYTWAFISDKVMYLFVGRTKCLLNKLLNNIL